ncbi:hypothetical protein CVIRNUC_005937 [Coccomyxa viridis]|uniref:Nudix hydrolase domain-containing protein n=1 Tax=Coccomyxa viridis TaxID=1274662 RepID=A0AAV1I950_9CHLO|nr:hypothetical protein CVIRNUC_005937 [Coccomyxa viridis]
MSANMPNANLLDDLCTRFILNVPAEELQSVEKLMFLVEQAHWFYEDFCRDRDPSLPSLSLKAFAGMIFRHCPGLAPLQNDKQAIFAQFSAYKQAVPVMGAILLNAAMDKCLLVRGFKEHASWGFPRGKLAKDETDVECAVREVKEETGLDIAELILEDDRIERHIKQQRSKLFIVAGIEETTQFQPQVRGEIGGFAWHYVAHLPASEEASMHYNNTEGARHRFFQVAPYVSQLRQFVKRRKAQQQRGKKKKEKDRAQPSAVGEAEICGHAQPAETQSIEMVKEPGQSWLNFTFDRAAIMQSLAMRLSA